MVHVDCRCIHVVTSQDIGQHLRKLQEKLVAEEQKASSHMAGENPDTDEEFGKLNGSMYGSSDYLTIHLEVYCHLSVVRWSCLLLRLLLVNLDFPMCI